MIPNTVEYYVFIRLSIWALRSIVPVSTAYCLVRWLGYMSPIPWPLEALAHAEVAFYLLVSLPKQWSLNQSRPRAIRRSRQEREALFQKCWASIPDLKSFLKSWFRGASLDSIHHQDMRDFLAWGFLYKPAASSADNDELDVYVRQTEEKLGRSFTSGRGPNRPSQVSIDVLRLQHKPLFFYVLAVGADDFMTYATARWIGLRHFRLPMNEFFTVFPFRPHTLFTQSVSPSKNLSYWYRPHTSKIRKPVLFIHGIGAGMRTYTGFLNDFIKRTAQDDDGGQVGIIALELMPIAMRITKGMLPRAEMLAEIFNILDYHQWDQFVILAHSYGTIIATHIVQELGHTDRVGPLLLVDPVTFSIHWGGIPYNFIYRYPRKASEWQLHYFASTDMCVAHSITRRFDWSENVMWKEDMKGRKITVALAEGDIIMDTVALRHYLVDDSALNAQVRNGRAPLDKENTRRNRRSKEETSEVDVLWYDRLNHAEIWDSVRDWTPLVEILVGYCWFAE